MIITSIHFISFFLLTPSSPKLILLSVVADAIWAAYNKSKELGSDDGDKEKGDKSSKVK
jgi:hypothetical protein